ncbi:FeoB-associated Cys-rich membrane protein [Polaribacter sp. Asnod1-A03]|uniref:FeoB-associated Cys-rich membrane protein n=1 Tax=Polaribacter sp. Asnod1-A03 TaxID=3160581 RepID=UPI00386DA1D4
MAINSIIWFGFIGLCFVIFNLSNFKLMQEIIIYILLFLAIVYLVKKYFFRSKKKSNCGTDCGCH